MILAYCDGACRGGNPGTTSCAFAIYEGATQLHAKKFFLGYENELRSNNFAEYQGLLRLLEYLGVNQYKGVAIHCDSKLVVEQVNQRWACVSPELKPMMARAYALLTRGCHILKHVRGHSGNAGNEAVDLLCNQVLDDNGVPRGSSWVKEKSGKGVAI